MPYFLDYDMQPCWFCGRTDCNGDHSGPEADAAHQQIVWNGEVHDKANCPCENCKSYRQRVSNRENP